MTQTQNEQTVYDCLREKLPRNYRHELAFRCKVSTMLVYQVLRETRQDNYGIIDAAYQLANEHVASRQRTEDLKRKIKSQGKSKKTKPVSK